MSKYYIRFAIGDKAVCHHGFIGKINRIIINNTGVSYEGSHTGWHINGRRAEGNFDSGLKGCKWQSNYPTHIPKCLEGEIADLEW